MSTQCIEALGSFSGGCTKSGAVTHKLLARIRREGLLARVWTCSTWDSRMLHRCCTDGIN